MECQLGARDLSGTHVRVPLAAYPSTCKPGEPWAAMPLIPVASSCPSPHVPSLSECARLLQARTSKCSDGLTLRHFEALLDNFAPPTLLRAPCQGSVRAQS